MGFWALLAARLAKGAKRVAKRVKKVPKPSLKRLRRKKVMESRLSGKAKYTKQVEAKRIARQRADVRQAIAKGKATRAAAAKTKPKVTKKPKVDAKPRTAKTTKKPAIKTKKKPKVAEAVTKPSRIKRAFGKIGGGFKWIGRNWKALAVVGVIVVVLAAIGAFGDKIKEIVTNFFEDVYKTIVDLITTLIEGLFEALGVILEEIMRGILGLLANPWVLLIIGLAVAGLFLWWYFTKRHVVKIKREKAKSKKKKK